MQRNPLQLKLENYPLKEKELDANHLNTNQTST